MSIESGGFTFHTLLDADVAYLTLTDKSYPKKLAFQYLEELQSEFSRLYGPQIEGVTRPYAFIKFGARAAVWRGTVWRTRGSACCVTPAAAGCLPALSLTPATCAPRADTFIQKTKKLYLDTRTQRNLAKLNQDIAEVHSIMTRNIQEVLGQGERLDSECGRGACGEGRGAVAARQAAAESVAPHMRIYAAPLRTQGCRRCQQCCHRTRGSLRSKQKTCTTRRCCASTCPLSWSSGCCC